MGGLFSSPSKTSNASTGATTSAPTGAPTGASKYGIPEKPKHKYTTKSQLGMAIKKYEKLIASGEPILPDDQYVLGFAPFNPDTDFNLLTAENTDPNILESRGELSDDDTKNALYTQRLVDRIDEIFPNNGNDWGGGARKRRRKTRKVKGKKSRKQNKKQNKK